jgi:hypothetical protein
MFGVYNEMKVSIYPKQIVVKRESSDKPIYKDSELWYKIKNQLNRQLNLDGRHKLVKKLMYKDGHLYGDDLLHYIVTGDASNKVGEVWMVYDGDYAIRSMYKAFNLFQPITLLLEKYSNQTVIWQNDQRTKIILELVEPGDLVRMKVNHNNTYYSIQEAHVKDYKSLTLDDVMGMLVELDKESLQSLPLLAFNLPFERIV